MIRKQKSQDSTDIEGGEEENYLIELLEKARSKHNVNSWEEFAALITLRSGDQVSGNTFRRNIRKRGSWKFLSLSLLQWAAIAEITEISMAELVSNFKSTLGEEIQQ